MYLFFFVFQKKRRAQFLALQLKSVLAKFINPYLVPIDMNDFTDKEEKTDVHIEEEDYDSQLQVLLALLWISS